VLDSRSGQGRLIGLRQIAIAALARSLPALLLTIVGHSYGRYRTLQFRAVGLAVDQAVKLPTRDQFTGFVATPLSAVGTGAAVGLLAALSGSAEELWRSAWAHPERPVGQLFGGVSSLAVSGGGSVVSGTGTDADRLSGLLRNNGLAGQGQYQGKRRRCQQTVKSSTFHHVISQNLSGDRRVPYVSSPV
jgi:hypothetical protein